MRIPIRAHLVMGSMCLFFSELVLSTGAAAPLQCAGDACGSITMTRAGACYKAKNTGSQSAIVEVNPADGGGPLTKILQPGEEWTVTVSSGVCLKGIVSPFHATQPLQAPPSADGVNPTPHDGGGSQSEQGTVSATDVAIGADGSIYVIGTAPCDEAGCGIFHFAGGRFQQIEGSAVHIAVDPAGNPWVVNRFGGIYRMVDGHFQAIAGTASDVGVGADGSVFVIGTAPCDAAGCGIYRFDGSMFQQIDGSGVNVAVNPAGNPWVVNRAGSIFRMVDGSFQMVPGSASAVGVGANGTVFIVGMAPCDPKGCGIARFDGTAFRAMEGSAVRIAVDRAGNPWIVNRSGGIFRFVGGHFEQVEGPTRLLSGAVKGGAPELRAGLSAALEPKSR